MRISLLPLSFSLSAFALALADNDSPVLSSSSYSSSVFEVPLIRNPTYRSDFQAQMQKMRNRYGSPQDIVSAKKGVGRVPVTNPAFDTEYYGPIKIGTLGQTFNMNFDTGSSDIWVASSTCTSAPCKSHRRFNLSKSKTFLKDTSKRVFQIAYGDGSFATGTIASDMINVGGIQVRQTMGLATNESADFEVSKMDGMFGLAFSNFESVQGVRTFMENAMEEKVIALPVVSAYLPSVRRSKGKRGHYLFGAIDSTKYRGALTYVPLTMKGYWQVTVQDVLVNGQSLSSSYQGIIDTGSTLVMLDDKTAFAVHSKIKGARFDKKEMGWVVPCSLGNSNNNSSSSGSSVGFRMAGRVFEVPMVDMAWEPVKEGSKTCFSGVQSMEGINVWILGDMFIKNNYCVFDHSPKPSVGIAPLK
ncbi:MAG: aspartic peptidase domain-containing protein [Linnemannia gamsii]|nr:MAG: aspartic peptidase domain-containing protein [Linnemannia gamsii]